MNTINSQNTHLVFDMDGVILNSLDGLSSCLSESVKSFCQSSEQLNKFTEFDRANPGLSRFEKIDYFMSLLKETKHLNLHNLKQHILEDFNSLSLETRLNSDVDDFIYKIPKYFPTEALILLSNCDNEQLETLVANFGFHQIFQGGIFGTPPNKELRMKEIIKISGNSRIISISDSESDAIISRSLGLNFVFIQKYARDSAPWLNENELRFEDIGDFISKMSF